VRPWLWTCGVASIRRLASRRDRAGSSSPPSPPPGPSLVRALGVLEEKEGEREREIARDIIAPLFPPWRGFSPRAGWRTRRRRGGNCGEPAVLPCRGEASRTFAGVCAGRSDIASPSFAPRFARVRRCKYTRRIYRFESRARADPLGFITVRFSASR